MKKKSKTTSIFLKSEFWLTLVPSVAGILLAFGIVTPAQAEGISTHVPTIIGALLSLLSTCKFVSTQHNAKVEVFHALFNMRMGSAAPGRVSAQSASVQEAQVIDMALAAGL